MALRAARTRTVFVLQNEVIISFDRAGCITWMSRPIDLPIGRVTPGMQLPAFMLDGDDRMMEELLVDVFDRRVHLTLEVAVISEGKPRMWYDARIAPVLVDDAVAEVVAVMHDITDARVLEDLKETRNEIMTSITSLSVRLLRAEADELDAMIMQALEMLSRHTNMDAGVLFWIEDDATVARATHEWRAAGLPARARLFEAVRAEDHPRALSDLNAGLPYQVTRGPAHPATEVERAVLDSLDTNAYLLVPISGINRLIGFLAFESSTALDGWDSDTVLPLRIAADALGGALVRHWDNEKLRTANAELLRAGKLKDEFLAMMSHELRTPLTSILGVVDVLRMQREHPLTERQLHFVGVIDQSGRQLLGLINDVLDIAKIEAGMMTLSIEQCVLDSICTTAIDLVRVQAEARGHALELELERPPIQLRCDTRRVQQILLNLLSNAIKFTPRGGRIRLTTQLDAAAQTVQITVCDSGIGIPTDVLPRIFDPFMQVQSDLKREHGGTGLGLPLVRRMVELHGGSITIESTPGEGSVFTIILPLQPPAP